MGSFNRAIIAGNLGQDPEYKDTEGGPMCRFSVATNNVWTTKDGEKKEQTTWHNISVFGKQAATCRDYLKKGRSVLVEGSIVKRQYKNKEGIMVNDSGIKADRVTFMGQKPKAESYDEPFA